MVPMGSKFGSTFYPGRISKTASGGEVIEVIANITGGRAVGDIGYVHRVKNRVDLTLSHYFVTSYPPGILEENDGVPLDVVGD